VSPTAIIAAEVCRAYVYWWHFKIFTLKTLYFGFLSECPCILITNLDRSLVVLPLDVNLLFYSLETQTNTNVSLIWIFISCVKFSFINLSFDTMFCYVFFWTALLFLLRLNLFLSSYPAFFPPLSPSPSHNYQHHHHYWHQHCYLNQADRGSIVKVFLFAYFLLVFVYVISFRFQILELKRRILFHLAIFYKEQLSLQNS